MNHPIITETAIRTLAAPESFVRGATYYQHGMVESLVVRGDQLLATVSGSEEYAVVVRFTANAIAATQCTCPYDWGGICKHIVAALLAYLHTPPETLDVRPPLADLLAGLDREQLLALVLDLADSSPMLAQQIDDRLVPPPPLVAPLNPVPMAASDPLPIPVDTEGFRRQIVQLFRRHRATDWDAYEEILTALEEPVQRIQTLITAHNSANALALLEVLTDEYSERWIDFDDSSGELGMFFEQLGLLWAEALLLRDPSAAELQHWADRLDQWSAAAMDYGCEGLSIAWHAANEGWHHPWVAAALRGETAPGDGSESDVVRALFDVRLRILERTGRIAEALNLARIADLPRQRAQLLVRQNRIGEAFTVVQDDLRTPADALAFAITLNEQGRIADALSVAERGLDLARDQKHVYGIEGGRIALARWLLDQVLTHQYVELAVRTGVTLIHLHPELESYRRLATLLGPRWPELRPNVIAMLRTGKQWNVSGRIAILLHEEMIDEAIALLGPHAPSDYLVQVMNAAADSHADWVIKTATAQAEAIMDAGKANSYDAAIDWLQRARKSYILAGREKDWAAYLAHIRAKHARKTKLLRLLQVLRA
jgi:uncharacterized Zn finger protein